VRESSGTSKRRLAEDKLKIKVAGALLGDHASLRNRTKLAELTDAMLRDYRLNEHKSLDSTQRRWEKHLTPFFGDARVTDITSDRIDEYVDVRKRQGASNSTVNRELAALKRALKIGYRMRKVQYVPPMPRLAESAPRRGFVEQQQYQALCEHCPELWFRSLLAVGYTFGFRKGELLAMRVQQIDLLNHSLALDPGSTKNDEGRTVKMTQEVYALLTECVRGKNPDDHVFTRDTEPVRNFRGLWYALCEKAGLGKWVKGPDKIERWEGLIFHDLRRSAVRNMVRRGVSERVAMMISGHKTRSIFDRYNIVSEKDLTEAASRIEAGAGAPPLWAQYGHSPDEAKRRSPV
jgi:integrase